ncbi:hypothetical protein BKI51_06985 [Alphaproteobacteria bacterium AO1-B]|nr:hypothetical protein BKI51_06985 [Alphaproteobacteria bacterium AO1-B]
MYLICGRRLRFRRVANWPNIRIYVKRFKYRKMDCGLEKSEREQIANPFETSLVKCITFKV